MGIFILILLCVILFLYNTKKSNKSKKKLRQKPYLKQTNQPTYTPKLSHKECQKPFKLYPELYFNKLNIMTKKARKEHKNFTVFDLETTGLSPITDSIIEIGAVKISDGQIIDSFSTLVNPGHYIPAAATKANGITDDMVKDAPKICDVLPAFLQFVGNDVLVGHNAYSFDIKFLLVAAYDNGIEIKNPVVDTLPLCRKLYPEFKDHKLGTIAKELCIEMDNAHRSLCDATATAQIFLKCIDKINKLDEIKAQERKMAKEASNKAAAGK